MGLGLLACASDPAADAGTDAGPPVDAGGLDGGAGDAMPIDGSVTDGGATDGGLSVFGFSLRLPKERQIPCTGMFCGGPTITAQDADYVCDLVYGGLNHYLYVQAHPVSFLDFMGFLYEVDGAWISDGTQLSPVTAVYNWGGNHHNDTLTVDAPGYQVRYDHSSFGFGFRRCQPMDCLVVYEAGPGAELANGCDRDRSVPAICKQVPLDGTWPEFIDTFARCPGDT